jgi:hypothetical protein
MAGLAGSAGIVDEPCDGLNDRVVEFEDDDFAHTPIIADRRKPRRYTPPPLVGSVAIPGGMPRVADVPT